jgi:hypothetical protein
LTKEDKPSKAKGTIKIDSIAFKIPKTDGAYEYKIEMKWKEKNKGTQTEIIYILASDSTGVDLTGLKKGTKYTFTITAIDQNGTAAGKSVKFSAKTLKFSKPTKVTLKYESTVNMTWQAPKSGAESESTQYQIVAYNGKVKPENLYELDGVTITMGSDGMSASIDKAQLKVAMKSLPKLTLVVQAVKLDGTEVVYSDGAAKTVKASKL